MGEAYGGGGGGGGGRLLSLLNFIETSNFAVSNANLLNVLSTLALTIFPSTDTQTGHMRK